MKEAIENNKMTVKYYFNLDAVKSERIIKRCYYTTASTYIIFNYDKNYMSFDDVNTGLYRSIIFSYPDKDVKCFSPPKSIPQQIFMKNYPNPTENIWINEAIEGVAINLFYDNNIKSWVIATKNSIGGNYWFYGKGSGKQPTFLDMFIESLRGSMNDSLNDIAMLEYFPKDYCYNFVMQHPCNTIILPVENSCLYLIGVYKLNYIEVEYIPQTEYQSWKIFKHMEGIINFPKQYLVSDYKDLLEIDVLIKGFMITNMETGERTKLTNKRYDDLKILLRIKPEIQYHFLCLYRMGKINEYLNYFPKMKKEFYIMRYFLEQFMKNVHKAYLSKYVYKDGEDILEKYGSHIYKIHHNIYLPVLNKNTIARVRYSTVVDYFNKMEPRELIYILNWDARTENL
jgi:hypothetical protein